MPIANTKPQAEERLGGKRPARRALVAGIALLVLLFVFGGVTAIARRTSATAPGNPPDSAKVLWSKWVGGKPDEFAMRVRFYRTDGAPVDPDLVAPRIVDTATGKTPKLHGKRTVLENRDDHAPGRTVEVTIRARMSAPPVAPVQIGFKNAPSIHGESAFWAQVLGPLYTPPRIMTEVYRLNGDPAVLVPLRTAKPLPRQQ